MNDGSLQGTSREIVAMLEYEQKPGSRPDFIPTEVWIVLGKDGVSRLKVFFNKIATGDRIPGEWRKSVLLALFMNKGYQLTCDNYIGIMFMSLTMKL